mgnify:CR=1 FL=1
MIDSDSELVMYGLNVFYNQGTVDWTLEEATNVLDYPSSYGSSLQYTSTSVNRK